MNPVTTAWILFAVVGAICGVLLDLTVMMIRAAINKTKPWLVALDEEGGVSFLGRAKMVAGQLIVGKGDTKKHYPVKSESRHITNNGIAYVVGRQTGVNLVTPSKDDIRGTLIEGEKVYFEVCDPLLLAKVMDKRQVQETLEGQSPQDDWKKGAIIPVAILGGLAIIGLIIMAAVAMG